MSSFLNKGAPPAFQRLPDHTQHEREIQAWSNCLPTSLSLKVFNQWMRASERAHCSLISRASSPVRVLRNRSCGESLRVMASKIPRESVMSVPLTCRTASSVIGAPCISDQASRVNHRDSSANTRARVSPSFEPAVLLGKFEGSPRTSFLWQRLSRNLLSENHTPRPSTPSHPPLSRTFQSRAQSLPCLLHRLLLFPEPRIFANSPVRFLYDPKFQF